MMMNYFKHNIWDIYCWNFKRKNQVTISTGSSPLKNKIDFFFYFASSGVSQLNKKSLSILEHRKWMSRVGRKIRVSEFDTQVQMKILAFK